MQRDFRADPRPGDVIRSRDWGATPRLIRSVHPDGVETSPTMRRGKLGGRTRSSFIHRDRFGLYDLVAEAGPKVPSSRASSGKADA